MNWKAGKHQVITYEGANLHEGRDDNIRTRSQFGVLTEILPCSCKNVSNMPLMKSVYCLVWRAMFHVVLLTDTGKKQNLTATNLWDWWDLIHKEKYLMNSSKLKWTSCQYIVADSSNSVTEHVYWGMQQSVKQLAYILHMQVIKAQRYYRQ